MPKNKQYYFRCIHEGGKSNIGNNCEAMIYLTSSTNDANKEIFTVTSINTLHKNHFIYSQDNLRSMIKICDIPEAYKLSASKWNPAEIFIKLRKDHPNFE